MKKFKQLLEEKIILSAVMCVLLAVVLITATYAWYYLKRTVKAYGLELSTGGTGGLIVAIEPGGDDIMMVEPPLGWIFEEIDLSADEDGIEAASGSEDVQKIKIASIPINLGNFENIEDGLIAPGAYGPLPFYITSLSANITSYEMKIQFKYKPHTDESADTLTPEEQEALQEKIDYVEEMIQDHFTIYQKKSTRIVRGEEVVSFEDPLTFYWDGTDQTASTSGSLLLNEEVPVELWWVWNYELTDIPDYENLERFVGDGDEKLDLSRDENGIVNNEADTRMAIRQYDEEDTELGNYIDEIWFDIYIDGKLGAVSAAEQPEPAAYSDVEAESDAGSEAPVEEGAEAESSEE